jgi:hypothetical protein
MVARLITHRVDSMFTVSGDGGCWNKPEDGLVGVAEPPGRLTG